MKQVRLNSLEIWIADHAAPIFLVIAALIVAGAIAVFVTYRQQSNTADQVRVLKPQVTRVNKAICDKQSLIHSQRAERCAERIRVGLINCRHSQPCRAAWLALATYPPPAREVSSGSGADTRGGAIQKPSNHGHQHPGPGQQPGHSTPSPSPGPAPTGPGASEGAPGQTGANPGQSGAEPPGQSGANRGQSSGVGVEVCTSALCLEAEVGLPDLKPKGLVP